MVQRVPSWRHRQVGITLEGQNLSLIDMVSPIFKHFLQFQFLNGAEFVPSTVVILKMLIFVVVCFIHGNHAAPSRCCTMSGATAAQGARGKIGPPPGREFATEVSSIMCQPFSAPYEWIVEFLTL